MIKIENLSVFGETEPILSNISLDVPKGRTVALLGSSGVGKTTLLRAIAGFIKPDGGKIILNEIDQTRTPPENRSVSMLFQDLVLFDDLTVQQNALVVKKYSGEPINDAWKKFNMYKLIEKLHIEEIKNRRIRDNLSGGEKQRAALLRVFMNPNKILLLDEPLKSSLNVELRWELRELIKTLLSGTEITTIYVTHDFNEAAYIADEIAVITKKGESISSGHAKDLYEKPHTLEVAKILGNGSLIPGKILNEISEREVNFMVSLDQELPVNYLSETDKYFIRPENVKIQYQGFGFQIINIDFLGENSLITLKPKTNGEHNSDLRIKASIPSSDLDLITIGSEVGVFIKVSNLLAYNQYEKLI